MKRLLWLPLFLFFGCDSPSHPTTATSPSLPEKCLCDNTPKEAIKMIDQLEVHGYLKDAYQGAVYLDPEAWEEADYTDKQNLALCILCSRRAKDPTLNAIAILNKKTADRMATATCSGIDIK